MEATTKPTINVITPFSSTLQIDQSIKLLFNQIIKAGSGDIVISNGSDTRTIAVGDGSQVIFDEASVTINPTADLMIGTTYSLHIASGVIVDIDGNAYVGNSGAAFSFTTIAATNPVLTSSNVSNDALEFQVDQDIYLNFDESVMAGSGDIIISNGMDNRIISADDTSQVTFSGGKVTIDPTEDLLGDTAYSIQVADGVITDTAGNAYVGGSTTFATITTAPELLSSNPASNSTLKSDEDLKFIFNRTITAGQGEIIISNGSDTRTIAIDDVDQVSFSRNAVTINPIEDLNTDTIYHIQMAHGVITDTAGHDFAGFSDATFTTIAPNPTLLHSNPANNSELIIDDGIKLFFDEVVTAGSGDIIISNGTDTRTIAIDDTNQVTFNFNEITIKPTDELLVDMTYRIQIDNGAITDEVGHVYEGFAEGVFTTIDSDPFLYDSEPFLFGSGLDSESRLKVDDGIELYFDELVKAGHGSIIISNGVDTRTIAIDDASQVTFIHSADQYFSTAGVTINPTGGLIADTTCTVQIGAGVITDTAGHAYAGFNDGAFSTIDSEPLLVASNPANKSTFKVNNDIELIFDEAVKAGSGNIVISNGTDTRIIAIDDTSQVTFSHPPPLITTANTGRTSNGGGTSMIVINPTEDLMVNTTYTVQIDSGVIVDTAEHSYAGFSNATFSTIASDPLLISSNPIEGSTIKVDGDIELQFDETVTAGSGDIIISDGTDTHTIAINDTSQVKFNGGKVTINPLADLKSNTAYSVQIASGVIIDSEGDPYGGFSDAVVTATDSNPLLASASFRDNRVVELNFDEEVVAGNGDIIISNGSDIRSIDINDTSQVVFVTTSRAFGSGITKVGSIVIQLTDVIVADSEYGVQIASGVINDAEGNPYIGSNDVPILSFITREGAGMETSPLFEFF